VKVSVLDLKSPQWSGWKPAKEEVRLREVDSLEMPFDEFEYGVSHALEKMPVGEGCPCEEQPWKWVVNENEASTVAVAKEV
jgi:hypothetical protein